MNNSNSHSDNNNSVVTTPTPSSSINDDLNIMNNKLNKFLLKKRKDNRPKIPKNVSNSMLLNLMKSNSILDNRNRDILISTGDQDLPNRKTNNKKNSDEKSNIDDSNPVRVSIQINTLKTIDNNKLTANTEVTNILTNDSNKIDKSDGTKINSILNNKNNIVKPNKVTKPTNNTKFNGPVLASLRKDSFEKLNNKLTNRNPDESISTKNKDVTNSNNSSIFSKLLVFGTFGLYKNNKDDRLDNTERQNDKVIDTTQINQNDKTNESFHQIEDNDNNNNNTNNTSIENMNTNKISLMDNRLIQKDAIIPENTRNTNIDNTIENNTNIDTTIDTTIEINPGRNNVESSTVNVSSQNKSIETLRIKSLRQHDSTTQDDESIPEEDSIFQNTPSHNNFSSSDSIPEANYISHGPISHDNLSSADSIPEENGLSQVSIAPDNNLKDRSFNGKTSQMDSIPDFKDNSTIPHDNIPRDNLPSNNFSKNVNLSRENNTYKNSSADLKQQTNHVYNTINNDFDISIDLTDVDHEINKDENMNTESNQDTNSNQTKVLAIDLTNDDSESEFYVYKHNKNSISSSDLHSSFYSMVNSSNVDSIKTIKNSSNTSSLTNQLKLKSIPSKAKDEVTHEQRNRNIKAFKAYITKSDQSKSIDVNDLDENEHFRNVELLIDSIVKANGPNATSPIDDISSFTELIYIVHSRNQVRENKSGLMDIDTFNEVLYSLHSYFEKYTPEEQNAAIEIIKQEVLNRLNILSTAKIRKNSSLSESDNLISHNSNEQKSAITSQTEEHLNFVNGVDSLQKEKLEPNGSENSQMNKKKRGRPRLNGKKRGRPSIETKRRELEKLAGKKMNKQNLEQHEVEEEALNKKRIEAERLQQERTEKEKIEKERIERERIEKERLEDKRLTIERMEIARLEKERLEKERLEKERSEKERLENEKFERERTERDILEKQRSKEEITEEKTYEEKPAQERIEKEDTIQEKAELEHKISRIRDEVLLLESKREMLKKQYNIGAFLYANKSLPKPLSNVLEKIEVLHDYIVKLEEQLNLKVTEKVQTIYNGELLKGFGRKEILDKTITNEGQKRRDVETTEAENIEKNKKQKSNPNIITSSLPSSDIDLFKEKAFEDQHTSTHLAINGALSSDRNQSLDEDFNEIDKQLHLELSESFLKLNNDKTIGIKENEVSHNKLNDANKKKKRFKTNRDIIDSIINDNLLKKDNIIDIIDSGVVSHDPFTKNSSVSTSNNICSFKNYEFVHTASFQQMDKRNRILFKPYGRSLTENYIKRQGSLIVGKSIHEKIIRSEAIANDKKENQKKFFIANSQKLFSKKSLLDYYNNPIVEAELKKSNITNAEINSNLFKLCSEAQLKSLDQKNENASVLDVSKGGEWLTDYSGSHFYIVPSNSTTASDEIIDKIDIMMEKIKYVLVNKLNCFPTENLLEASIVILRGNRTSIEKLPQFKEVQNVLNKSYQNKGKIVKIWSFGKVLDILKAKNFDIHKIDIPKNDFEDNRISEIIDSGERTDSQNEVSADAREVHNSEFFSNNSTEQTFKANFTMVPSLNKDNIQSNNKKEVGKQNSNSAPDKQTKGSYLRNKMLKYQQYKENEIMVKEMANILDDANSIIEKKDNDLKKAYSLIEQLTQQILGNQFEISSLHSQLLEKEACIEQKDAYLNTLKSKWVTKELNSNYVRDKLNELERKTSNN